MAMRAALNSLVSMFHPRLPTALLMAQGSSSGGSLCHKPFTFV
jgi:hypothetical protein